MDKINQHAKNDGNKNHAKKNLWNYSQQISNDLRHAIWYENKKWKFSYELIAEVNYDL